MDRPAGDRSCDVGHGAGSRGGQQNPASERHGQTNGARGGDNPTVPRAYGHTNTYPNYIQVLPEDLVASQQPGLDQDRVGTILRAFYSSLFSTVAPHFERLQDPEFREITRKQTAEVVSNSHAKVRVFLLRIVYRACIYCNTFSTLPNRYIVWLRTKRMSTTSPYYLTRRMKCESC